MHRCCTCPAWATKLDAVAPYSSTEELLEAADRVWFACSADDWRQGFAGHGKLGAKVKEQKVAAELAATCLAGP